LAPTFSSNIWQQRLAAMFGSNIWRQHLAATFGNSWRQKKQQFVAEAEASFRGYSQQHTATVNNQPHYLDRKNLD
jgi:hypothetical protein